MRLRTSVLLAVIVRDSGKVIEEMSPVEDGSLISCSGSSVANALIGNVATKIE